MVTRYYHMVWDLDKCIGCQVGPLCCPKDAEVHVPGVITGGRLTRKPSVDIDAEKCILCGICEVMCPKNAILVEINGEHENPVLIQNAWPVLTQSTVFDVSKFDWKLKDFVIKNCPTNVISYDEAKIPWLWMMSIAFAVASVKLPVRVLFQSFSLGRGA